MPFGHSLISLSMLIKPPGLGIVQQPGWPPASAEDSLRELLLRDDLLREKLLPAMSDELFRRLKGEKESCSASRGSGSAAGCSRCHMEFC